MVEIMDSLFAKESPALSTFSEEQKRRLCTTNSRSTTWRLLASRRLGKALRLSLDPPRMNSVVATFTSQSSQLPYLS